MLTNEAPSGHGLWPNLTVAKESNMDDDTLEPRPASHPYQARAFS
jgi:hypothetical protein